MRRGNRRAQTCDRGATESLPAEAPAECGSVIPGNGIQALQATRPHRPHTPTYLISPGDHALAQSAQRLTPRAKNPAGRGFGGRAPRRGRSSRKGGAMREGGAPNGATARLFGEELQGCGAGLRHGEEPWTLPHLAPCSLSGTHWWVGGSCKALSHARWAASAEPLPPASGHTNSQALAAEQPLFSLLVNQAKECFLHRAVLVQLDLDLHRQGLWLVPAFHGWRRRF